jgi:serine O-acetyltransferase
VRFREYRQTVHADLYRYAGRGGFGAFWRHVRRTPGFKVTFWGRTCAYLKAHPVLRFGFYHLAACVWRWTSVKYGIMIPFTTEIGPGLFIGHFGCIVVHPDAVIGRNCNLSQGVTIGLSARGKREGVPTLGDNVYIAPGAKVFGAIRIGNDVAVGANAVVTRDVPDGAVVAGIPAEVISQEGSAGYVLNTDYE